MRTIIWTFVVCTLLAAMAVHGLDISSRDSADHGNGGGTEPSQYAR